jgi:zinc transport system ATP-binding protein
MALLLCKNLALAYENNTVLKNIDFSVESGDYLCVVGENGSGKSTLIKGLLRFIRPVQGSIMAGEGLGSNEIGYLPQQTAVQKDFPAGVYEVVLSGRLGRQGKLPFYTRSDRRIAGENLERLGIADLRKRCYRELSGGQQRRVLLARALCATRKLLVLDEPAAGLDPPVTQDLYRLLERINRDMEVTIIMVTHDIEGVVRYANKVLHLQNERYFFGSTEAYLKSGFDGRFVGAWGKA